MWRSPHDRQRRRTEPPRTPRVRLQGAMCGYGRWHGGATRAGGFSEGGPSRWGGWGQVRRLPGRGVQSGGQAPLELNSVKMRPPKSSPRGRQFRHISTRGPPHMRTSTPGVPHPGSRPRGVTFPVPHGLQGSTSERIPCTCPSNKIDSGQEAGHGQRRRLEPFWATHDRSRASRCSPNRPVNPTLSTQHTYPAQQGPRPPPAA